MQDEYLKLDTASGRATNSALYRNATVPFTADTFSIGSNAVLNGVGTAFTFYCFATVPGICAVGVYTGNAVALTGPVIGADFAPEFGIMKYQSNYNWAMHDRKRRSIVGGPADEYISCDNATAEATNTDFMNFVATGAYPMTTNGTLNINTGSMFYLLLGGIRGGAGLPPLPARI